MCIILYGAVGQNTSHNSMRFGIQSVGTLSGRSSRIIAATGTFDVGRRTDELLTFRRLRQRITGHGARGFKRCSESQATVDVATTAIINRKTSAGGSGDYTTPPPINTSTEHKIGQYSQDLPRQTCAVRELLTIRYLAVARPTQGRLAQFGRFCLHNLTVARPTKGRLALGIRSINI
ncbi:Uncharacterized protein FWK35_00000101 [Aphis craccivora]|uniref:Uncharacterized protein n=1 Tax=Aphis craccivora TaxID=307492 RepID=A0A6G0ZQQ9_APHCR|nr:Uncharacterized protein FWK35_00000101 [Aphis craccivora]